MQRLSLEPNPALVEHAQKPAESLQNRIADRSRPSPAQWPSCTSRSPGSNGWIVFRVEHYPYGLLARLLDCLRRAGGEGQVLPIAIIDPADRGCRAGHDDSVRPRAAVRGAREGGRRARGALRLGAASRARRRERTLGGARSLSAISRTRAL